MRPDSSCPILDKGTSEGWLPEHKEDFAIIPMKLYAFADEASGCVDGQITAMLRNGLGGLEIRGVDGQSIADVSVEKAHEV